MTLSVITFTLGLVDTNAYLLADQETKKAVVIDPAWDGRLIAESARENKWEIESIWLTHAHFDHIGGIVDLVNNLPHQPSIALHPDDLPLWKMQGGAPYFGMEIDPGPEPDLMLSNGQELFVGSFLFEVRFTPGHTPGHVVFYCAAERIMFCGDVIFWRSIGRTDLPGGNYNTLIDSIQNQILTLPDDVRLLTGHGPQTLVGDERIENPFL